MLLPNRKAFGNQNLYLDETHSRMSFAENRCRDSPAYSVQRIIRSFHSAESGLTA